LLEIHVDLYVRYRVPWWSRTLSSQAESRTLERPPENGRFLAFTTSGGEGIGGQFCRYLTAKHLSSRLGLTYAHHPFARNFHAPDLDWEAFLGAGECELPLAAVLHTPGLQVVELPFIDTRYHREAQLKVLEHLVHETHGGTNKLFLLTPWSFSPPEEGSDLQLRLARDFSAHYWRARACNPMLAPYRAGAIRVAAIVRRGELRGMRSSRRRWRRVAAQRWVESAWYIRVLEKLSPLIGQSADIRVFSDADRAEELPEFSGMRNVTLHLKGESPDQPFQALHAMATADVLICGLTGFCWPGGMLSTGPKIIPPRTEEIYFPRDQPWCEADADGEFDSAQLSRWLTHARAKSE
jgi:hypothetical protein